MTAATSLRVAVLINSFSSPNIPAVKGSFATAIETASPGAQTDFYDPIEGQIYPDPAAYDLIVLSGGTADPSGSDAWVLKVQGFLRRTAETWPQKKIMGVCWGHQTICVAFGGKVGAMEKAELGVTSIPLTAKGVSFFRTDELNIHEFHKREVKTPAPGFLALARENQSFVNEQNTILSFQGHPEMNSALARALLQTAPSYMCVPGQEKDAVAKTMDDLHDGENIWKRVVQWVKE